MCCFSSVVTANGHGLCGVGGGSGGGGGVGGGGGEER